MLQIKEYDFENFSSDKFDKKIINSLKELEKTGKFKNFFKELNKVVQSESNFSFIKASHNLISRLKKINTHINLEKADVEAYKKDIKQKQYYTLNDILELIFGYHLKARVQFLKKYFKALGQDNCVYCLAQYTTAYTSSNGELYIKGNLDHIYPKSTNALISLSLNNLVPVCAHCNQRKLDADLKDFNFNPFQIITNDEIPTFKFDEVLNINNSKVIFNDINNLKIENINPTLESRLEVTALYKEYKSPIVNLLDRYNKFNSSSYQTQIEKLMSKDSSHNTDVSDNLEFFISEIPYTDENIQNVPLHKFKNDFYKELEEYKKDGKVKFT